MTLYVCASCFSLLPVEPRWLGFVLPIVPLFLSVLLAGLMPLFHMTHTLQVVPEKEICTDTASHVTFDTSIFILCFCLPFLLTLVLILGLIFRSGVDRLY